MIYIDPPYNTKSENFIYNDNFKKSEEELIANFGLDENTTDFLQNVYGTRSHSGWLAFVYPRLKLARDLLKEDGVIFISIDDNEQANLKIMCDEIFGEENFVEIFKWNKTSTPPSLSNKVRGKYEFVLCYEKSNTNNIFNGGITEGGDMPLLNESNSINTLTIPKESIKFNFSGEYKHGIYDRVELLKNIKIENNYITEDLNIKGKFKWSQETINREVLEGTIFIIKTEKFAIRYIRTGERIKKPADIISKKECKVGTNEDANKEQKIIFNKVLFSNPKPTSLIKYLINFICDKNDLILDFFAGSGTTGDAVMQLNAEDRGNRKFILVQWDEQVKKNTEAYQFCTENNFKPVISSITIERLNRAGERLRNKSAMTRKGDSTQPKSHSEPKSHSALDAESLFKDEMADQVRHEDKQKVIASNDPQSQPHAQSHCGLDPQSQIDIGYKVFSLTKKPKLAEQGGLFRLVNERKSTADTLYNMLCATGKSLHTPFTELIKDRLYLVEEIPHQVRNDDNQTVIAGNDPQSQPHTQSHCGLDPQSQKYLYVLGEISPEQWDPIRINTDECQIYIDGYSDISLENWLNLFGLNEKDKEQVAVVY